MKWFMEREFKISSYSFRLFVLLLLFCILSILLLQHHTCANTEKRKKEIYSLVDFTPVENPPIILLLGMQATFNMTTDSLPCTFMEANETTLQETDFDALVIIWPDDPNINMTLLKSVRKPYHLYIFYEMESPGRSAFARFPITEAIFNWTWTYRRDSDIYDQYYGGFRVKSENSSNSNTSSTLISSELYQKLSSHSLAVPAEKLPDFYKRFIKQRRKNVMAWTSSHPNCTTQGNREELVKKLEEFIPVDKYGSCGNLSCKAGRFESNYQSCYEEHSERYKFYLAFENSLCTDYVTEKFFVTLKTGMLPIVYGGCNYSHFGPPGSYIDALSFPSVKELANHIKFLDENPEEYLKYFLWTEFFEIYTPSIPWVDICRKIWNASILTETTGSNGRKMKHQTLDPNYRQIHKNISSWWTYKVGQNFEAEVPFDPSWSPHCWPPPDFV